MEYYKLFNLEKEPFSNTPDPEFFFRSTRHAECLQKLELAIRLCRGLCIVHGEMGTGKTTLCRELVRLFAADENISVQMVLDPGFDSTRSFAATVNEMLTGGFNADQSTTTAEHKEMIKNYLFDTGVDHGKTTVLIIDEGQKLPAGCVEFLRELLNYETNDSKLLQIVIFAQNEIRDLLLSHPNFADRAALYYHLKPLNKQETEKLIRYRLQTAGSRDTHSVAPIFTRRALARIYRLSHGYPRKIINLGHNILLLMLVRGKKKVTPAIVKQASLSLPVAENTPFKEMRLQNKAVLTAGAALLGIIVLTTYARWPSASGPESKARQTIEHKKSPAESPQKALNHEATAEEVPSLLGWAIINKNENLWNMTRRIYGTSSAEIVKKLKSVNPDLKDPANIRAGRKIRFPVLKRHPVARHQRYWIVWEKSGNLNHIYQFVFARRSSGLEILSYWHPVAGLTHAAVNKKPFAGYNDAEQALNDQGRASEKRAGILDLSKNGIQLLTRNSDN